MLSAIGFATNERRSLSHNLLTRMPKVMITEVPLGDDCFAFVDAWVVALDKSDDPINHLFWLRRLNAPIVIITQRTSATLRLAPQIPKLTFICHPLRLENAKGLNNLLTLATRRTGGVSVMNAPRMNVITSGVHLCQ